MRELLSQEPVSLVPVTERNIPRFEASLAALGQLSQSESGMLPMTGNTQESPAEWLAGTKGLWLFGVKEADFSMPGIVAGFVIMYAREHNGWFNDWLV